MSRTFTAESEEDWTSPISLALPSPVGLRQVLPVPSSTTNRIAEYRSTIAQILAGTDPRLLLICGPCSLHDSTSALRYAERLKRLSTEVADQFFVVMRGYLEKPRSGLGWKGFTYDPHLDGHGNIEAGLHLSRQLLLDLAQMEIPVATEFLDPSTPSYYGDLVSWGCIGARTASSQIHRQLASGLSMPVGIKNTTSGDVEVAIQAVSAARTPQTHIGIDANGTLASVSTDGNPHTHVILRGGSKGPNYHPEAVNSTLARLEQQGLPQRLVIDCSHDNCGKCHLQQARVLKEVVRQLQDNPLGVAGIMLESHLQGGRQELIHGTPASPNISLTDPCLGWEETRELVLWACEQLEPQLACAARDKRG